MEQDRVGRTLLSVAFEVAFGLFLLFLDVDQTPFFLANNLASRKLQSEDLSQKRRTGVSAPHTQGLYVFSSLEK